MSLNERLMSLQEVAEYLGFSEQRIYQLDAELQPQLQRRGTKMVRRWYVPSVVERYRVSRGSKEKRMTTREVERVAAEIAAGRLLDCANTSPFFLGVATGDTERVREALRALAERLRK